MTHLIYLNYTDKHLISLFRILSEFELVMNDFPKGHESIKRSIKEALSKDYRARIFTISKAELNYLFKVYTWRITQLNQLKILSGINELHTEIKSLIAPLDGLDNKKYNTLKILLEMDQKA